MFLTILRTLIGTLIRTLMRVVVVVSLEVLLELLLVLLLVLLVARVGGRIAGAEFLSELSIELLVESLLLLFVFPGGGLVVVLLLGSWGDLQIRGDLERLSRSSLDGLEKSSFALVAEGDRDAGLSSSGGSTDAVDVGLRFHWKVVVHHMCDAVDIDAAGGDVGRDQDGDPTRTERTHDVDAFVLRLVGVDRIGAEFVGSQVSHEAVGSVLRLGEDESAFHRIPFQQGAKRLRFVIPLHHEDALVDLVDGRRFRCRFDLERVSEQ